MKNDLEERLDNLLNSDYLYNKSLGECYLYRNSINITTYEDVCYTPDGRLLPTNTCCTFYNNEKVKIDIEYNSATDLQTDMIIIFIGTTVGIGSLVGIFIGMILFVN